MPLHYLSATRKAPAVVIGVLSLLAGLSVLVLTPRPTPLLHDSGALSVLPPLWLLTLLHLVFYAVLGLIAGALWGTTPTGGGRECRLWRGCTGLVLGLMAVSVWYILLFGKHLIFFSWLFLPLAAICLLWTVISWSRITRKGALGAALCGIWPILLFLWQLRCMARA